MANLKVILKQRNLWLEKNRILLLRILIFGSILVACAIFTYRVAAGERYPRLLFLGILGIAGVLVLLRWPILGIILSIIGGMFSKYSGPGGINILVVGLAGMLGLWILDMLVKRRSIQFASSRTILPLFILILVSLVSFLFGQLPWYSYSQRAPFDTQVGGLLIFLLSFGAFLLVAHSVKELRWLQILTWTFVALGAFYVLGRAVRWGQIDQLYHIDFSAGSMFWTWLVAITFSQAFINRRLHWVWRMILGIVTLVALYVALTQAYAWKSGWLPPFVAIAAIFVCVYWRNAFLLLAPLGLIPLYFFITEQIGTETYSWGSRLDAWLIVIEIAKANPLLGLGFANYYWYTPLFPIRGFYVRFNSHSQYIDLIAQVGFIGLAIFFWFFWEVSRVGWRLRQTAPEGFARAYVFGALGGIAGTLVAASLVDWVLPFVYNIGMNGFRASVLAWVFLGGLVSIEQMALRKAES